MTNNNNQNNKWSAKSLTEDVLEIPSSVNSAKALSMWQQNNINRVKAKQNSPRNIVLHAEIQSYAHKQRITKV